MFSSNFKKRTNNEQKIKKINFFSFDKEPKKCKVVKVNDDLSCVIIMKFNKNLYKWNCILDHVPNLYSKYYKAELEKNILNKYLEIVINKFENNIIYGILYNGLKSINAYFSFMMHTNKTIEGVFKIHKYPILKRKPLETIHENNETTF